jgi:hypothetical protein
LLKTLVVSDCVVELACGLLWGIPRGGVDYYARHMFPWMAPFVIAISHMAVMTSNFTTGVMAFERFVRLQYICNFKPRSWITNHNLNYYRAAVIFFPIIFYTPKFFELKVKKNNVVCVDLEEKGQLVLAKLYQRINLDKALAKIGQSGFLAFMKHLNGSRYTIRQWQCNDKLM